MFLQDAEFKKAMLDINLTDKIKYCYQCNRCTTVCPIAQVAPGRYDPRGIIMASMLGLPQFVLNDDPFKLWACQVCDTCDEICPNNIELTEIFTLLKNMSVQKGDAPEYYTNQAKTILENGKAIPMQPAIARRRDKMGLPPEQKCDVNEIQTILKATGFDKKIAYKWEGQ